MQHPSKVGEHGTWNIFLVLGIWQVLSVLLTTSGVFSQLISQQGGNVPTAQSFTVYTVLLLVYGTLFVRERCEFAGGTPLPPLSPEPQHALARYLRVPAWQYAVLALIDVEANYLLVLAYQYTTIEEIQVRGGHVAPCFCLSVCL